MDEFAKNTVIFRGRPGKRVVSDFWFSVAAIAASGTVWASAAAQQAPSALPTRDELEPFAPPAQPRSRVQISGEIERSPCALDDPGYDNIKLTLTAVSFNKLGPVPAADLVSAYSRFLGTEQPVKVLCEIRDAAATMLRDRGYIAAVQVPTQRIEGGAVTFEVLYARLTTIRVLGSAGRTERLFESYLKPLAGGEVFNRFEAERYLLLARDVPGFDVRLSLKPAGTGAGEMVGEISLRRTPVLADFNVQNLAGRETGRIGGQFRAQFNGITGMGDRTQISLYSTVNFDEQQILQFGHDMLIGRDGLRIGGRLTHARSRPDLGAVLPDVKAQTVFANFEAGYPFLRSLGATVRGAIGFDFVSQKVRFAGAPLSRDRLSIGYARLDAEATDLEGVGPAGTIGWRLAGTIEARRGLDVFNASPDCFASPLTCSAAGFVPPSLADGNPTATVWRISGQAEGRIARNVLVSVSPRAQISASRLFAFEQFSTGNYTIGRGFDPGVLVGDSGFGFQTEIRAEGLKLSPNSKLAFQPYAFSDNAWVWDKGAGAANPFRLSSLGGGVRIGYHNRARLDMSLAVPTRRLPGETRRRDPRFLLSLTTNILPWSTR